MNKININKELFKPIELHRGDIIVSESGRVFILIGLWTDCNNYYLVNLDGGGVIDLICSSYANLPESLEEMLGEYKVLKDTTINITGGYRAC